MDLVFATHNAHKVEEVKPLLPANILLYTLDDLGCTYDIPETGNTLEDNALLKARYVTENYGKACFADDTGLLVKALDGAPGVHSARYAGEHRNAGDNIDKLLHALGELNEREARFETVIALVWDGGTRIFRGEVTGTIAKTRRGNNGFGYDPVFIPDGYAQTFAQLPLEEKNRFSHRARALQKLITFLGSQQTIGLPH